MKNQVNEEQNPSSIEHGGERQSVAFTPGPWEVGGIEKGLWVTGPDLRSNVICDIVTRTAEDTPTDVDWANARLIAAAPALYEALKATPCRYSRRRECSSNVIDMCDRCAALELVTPK